MIYRFLAMLSLLVLLAGTASATQVTPATADPELRRLLAEAIQSSSSFDDRFDAEVWLFDMSSRI